MKKIVFIMLLAACNLANAQEKSGVVTTTLSVRGNCGECKERIENAADMKGVKVSKWDSKAQMLTVTYKPEKVTPDQIKQSVLMSGHDVGDEKAPDAAYNKLPKCCKFRDRKCEK
jgi:periplasmic mercuric ion binding protein